MQLLSAAQIKAWDAYTIQHEPVSSIDLMERAARACADWLVSKGFSKNSFIIFCGKGNNGGDGLAIARLLRKAGATTAVTLLETGLAGSADFAQNLQRLQHEGEAPIPISSAADFPRIEKEQVVVDALFGAGLNKPLSGIAAALAQHINQSGATVISIDLPSGLFADQSSKGCTAVRATHTLTFQCYKKSLLMQENAPYVGEVHLLPIGLHPQFLSTIESNTHVLDDVSVRRLYRPRQRFSHKGNFGHALLVGGSLGKMGAAVLATQACLRSGAGLTSAMIPRCGYTVMQVSAPEAMVLMDESETHLSALPGDVEKFSAIGIGPGMGTHPDTQKLLSFLLRRYASPMVIDADGLNCLAQNADWLNQLPQQSVLTPHPKEFARLFGEQANDFDRTEMARRKANEYNIVVVLKSHHSFIALPGGQGYFNITGNAGMAKGGSGDVLTGIITALLAQGYPSVDAARLGVYLHGLAGDLAAQKIAKEAMLPSDLLQQLSPAFLSLHRPEAATSQ